MRRVARCGSRAWVRGRCLTLTPIYPPPPLPLPVLTRAALGRTAGVPAPQDESAADEARQRQIDAREVKVEAALARADAATALRIALENPPLGTKNEAVKVGAVPAAGWHAPVPQACTLLCPELCDPHCCA